MRLRRQRSMIPQCLIRLIRLATTRLNNLSHRITDVRPSLQYPASECEDHHRISISPYTLSPTTILQNHPSLVLVDRKQDDMGSSRSKLLSTCLCASESLSILPQMRMSLKFHGRFALPWMSACPTITQSWTLHSSSTPRKLFNVEAEQDSALQPPLALFDLQHSMKQIQVQTDESTSQGQVCSHKALSYKQQNRA